MRPIAGFSRFFLTVLCILFFSIGCSEPPTDEDVIRGVIQEMARASEAKDIKGMIRHVSEDYRDDYGNNRKALKGLFLYQVIRPEPITVFVRSVGVEVEGETALADIRVIMVRGTGVEGMDEILKAKSAGYRIDAVFGKEAGGAWRIKSAEWRDVGVAALF